MLDERRIERMMQATGISRLQAIRNVRNIERVEPRKREQQRAELLRRFAVPAMTSRVVFTTEG